MDFDKLAAPLVQVYEEITDQILENIARHFNTGKGLPTIDWQMRKLAEMGQLRQENIRIIARKTRQNPELIRIALENAAGQALKHAEPELKEAVRPVCHELLQQNPDRKWWSSAYNQGGTKYAWKFPDGEGFSRAPSEEMGKTFQDYEPDIPLRVFHIGPWLKERKVFHRLMRAKDQKEAYYIIREIRGFASFLAYQVFVDLTYIEEFPFSENEFTVAGPGCKRGLDLVFTDYNGMTHEEALFWLRDNLDEYFTALEAGDYARGKPWNPEKLFKRRAPEDRRLTVMSLENCFCELSKYVKAVNGTGRPRNRYKPTTEPYHYQKEE